MGRVLEETGAELLDATESRPLDRVDRVMRVGREVEGTGAGAETDVALANACVAIITPESRAQSKGLSSEMV